MVIWTAIHLSVANALRAALRSEMAEESSIQKNGNGHFNVVLRTDSDAMFDDDHEACLSSFCSGFVHCYEKFVLKETT